MEAPKNSFPLSWPLGWKRTQYRSTARFANHSIAVCCESLHSEMTKLGAKSVVISCNLQMRLDGLPYSNQRQPQDPGVAVYFTLSNQQLVLACDAFSKVEHNLWAIVKHIEALRGQKRWCVGRSEQAFAGYKALSENTQPTAHWRAEFAFGPETVTRQMLDDRYRSLAKVRHPDAGGNHESFVRLQRAYEAAVKEVR